ncbi:general stress protein [Streptomyces lichenis]|uniref:general stress protein n=1 Tax=Streptomyces lichenis TaxID=2306967 RepID=UPI0024A6EB33|nr:general stress protein [Streptomyces lichenis]
MASIGPGAPVERGARNPVSDAWNTVGSYDSYEEAQAAVDRLSDEMFPVENIDIVGSGLRLVEHVTGRLTKGRAAGAGAASGAWFGLFIGLLVGLFTPGPTWLGLILGGVLIGALWGAVFGFVGHAATGGRRDFSSTQRLVASKYDVIARGGQAERAREILRGAGPAAGGATPGASAPGSAPGAGGTPGPLDKPGPGGSGGAPA